MWPPVFETVFGDPLYNLLPQPFDSPTPFPFAEGNATALFKDIEALDAELLEQWIFIRVPTEWPFGNINDDQNQSANAYTLLTRTIERLQYVLHSLLEQGDRPQAGRIHADAQAFFTQALPVRQFERVLGFVLFTIGSKLLGIRPHRPIELRGLPSDEGQLGHVLEQIITGLWQVGLGGVQVDYAYAQAIDNLLDLILNEKVGDHGIGSWNQRDAEEYVAMEFIPFIRKLMTPLESLRADGVHLDEGLSTDTLSISSQSSDIRFWVCRAMEKMAKIMSTMLFDLIISGCVAEDDTLATNLEEITNTPNARRQVAVELHKQVAWYLLHPGSSTVSILDAYVQLIWALHRIDKSGALLVRTAHEITSFLHTRDDAVRIVILSLLEAGKEENGQPRQSSENFSGRIAQLMENAIEANAVFGTAYYPGKDQKDINWEPEPVDAYTGYRSARYRDAMGHMVTIKEKDAFIEELRTLLGDRLLKADGLSSWKEQRLLAMFKDRFEDFPIRECEVMVKDLQDSEYYHKKVADKRNISLETAQDFQVKILSNNYWPALREEKFELPPPMKQQLDDYSNDFQEVKQFRRLEWMNALGRVTVELELEDRTINEEVTTWQAAVIYQFDEDEMGRVSSAQPGTRSVADIEAATQMDEDLIRSALTFWVGKLVLLESITYPDAYTVLERLSNTSTASNDEDHLTALSSIAAAAAAAAQQAETEAAAAELKTAADLLAENAPLYTNFVVNMLTNQGHMPASRMMMMLKMLVAGGFPFEEVEFVEFLQGLAEEGKVEKAGGLWMVKKK